MTAVIGISCSTLVLPGMRGVSRFALAADYVRCVVAAGGLPLLLPNVEPGLVTAYLARVDGLVLSGGLDVDPVHYGEEPQPDLGQVDALRDGFELELARGAMEQGIPILAICRGHQVLNVAMGGTLLQHVPAAVKGALKHAQDAVQRDALAHTIEIVPKTRLAALAGTTRTRVNTFHHQALGRVAQGFVASAHAADGVVEAIEDPARPFCLGVQWHPERRPDDRLTRGLFDGLIEAAAAAAAAGARAGDDRA